MDAVESGNGRVLRKVGRVDSVAGSDVRIAGSVVAQGQGDDAGRFLSAGAENFSDDVGVLHRKRAFRQLGVDHLLAHVVKRFDFAEVS